MGGAIYDASRQRVTANVKGRPAKAVVFTVRVTNRGDAADRMAVKGTPRNTRFAVVYLRGSANISTAVANGTYRTGTLAPDASTLLTVRVTKAPSVPIGSTRTFAVRSASTNDSAKVDTVAAVVKAVRG